MNFYKLIKVIIKPELKIGNDIDDDVMDNPTGCFNTVQSTCDVTMYLLFSCLMKTLTNMSRVE